MTEKDTSIRKLRELKTFDPKIIIEKKSIWLKPNNFNYSALVDYFCILVIIIILPKQKTIFMFCVFSILILIFIILIFSKLRFNNAVCFDLENRILIIKPNILIQILGRKQSIYKFQEIKKIEKISNIDSTGFWLAYRRFYLKITFKNKKEEKIISSGKAEIIDVIVNLITPIF